MNQLPHVVVVDDEQELCELLCMRLEHHGYRTTSVNSAPAALELLGEAHIDAMIVDLRLGEASGLDVLGEVQKRSLDIPVVILTAHGSIETAAQAMRQGAYGFLTKPFHDHELLQKIAHAVESSSLRREVAGLRKIVGASETEARLLGTSAAIARVREIIARIAPTEATIMITGESGTGKELAARAVHAMSPRHDGPFVAINCGALPNELLESELFGHLKGSFTGATQNKNGLFAAARGGTLFLDEIGEASLAVQVKLLRVLQERRFSRVGATTEEEADVRVIAATNRDLRAQVNEGRFRQDLFYRLHVVPLHMPPLRERQGDIPGLAGVFLERAAARYGLPVPRFSRDAVEFFLRHPWPGNVRELANVTEAALLLARSQTISASDLLTSLGPLSNVPPSSAPQPPSAPLALPPAPLSAALAGLEPLLDALRDERLPLPPLKEARDQFERLYLSEVLRRASGSVTAAARLAGRNRTDFYELLRRHNLSAAEFKD